MRYVKGKCPTKRMSRKFAIEVTNYIHLWNLCLVLLLDEVVNKSDNISLLTKYISENKKKFNKIDMTFEKTICSYVSIPLEAIELMVNCVAELNIYILNYKQNSRKINNYLCALHNLPRCLLSPQLRAYVNQREAIEYSLSYLNKSNF